MHPWRSTAFFAAAMGLFFFAACGDGGESGQAAATATAASSAGQGGGGGGEGGGPQGGMNVTKEFCGAVAAPFCSALFACCNAVVVLEAYGGTREACTDLLTADCLGDTAAQIEESMNAGQTALDSAQLDQCVAKLQAMADGGAACAEPPRIVLLTDCLAAYRGQIAAGEACTWTPEDLSFVHCKDGLCRQGSCMPFPATGEACSSSSSTNSLCNYTRGEWCLGDTDMGVCGLRGDIGAPCNHPGAQSYECKSGTCDQDGKCGAPTAEGVCQSAG